MVHHSTFATRSSLRLNHGRSQRCEQLNRSQEHPSPLVLAKQLGELTSRLLLKRRSKENVHLLLNLSRIMRTGEAKRRRRESNGTPTQSYLPDSRSNVLLRFDLQLPANKFERLRLLRPRIALHFGLMDGRSLGQVVIQLYTEAAPLVVLQFIRSCRRQRPHEFAVRRIFPNLWLEGYLLEQEARSVDPKPLLQNPMEFDTRVLSHEQHNCVLSCAKEYCVHGFPGGAINFSISFKPLSVANGQRVAFGRVLRGSKIIAGMQSYGTKNGKMVRPLVITHCDVL